MAVTIIKEVLEKEQDATTRIAKAEEELAKKLDEDKLSVEEKAQERISNAKERLAKKREKYVKRLEAERVEKAEELAKELKEYDRITDKQIDDVARKILEKLK